MHRFAVAADCLRQETLRLDGPPARQMRRVLRLGPGDRVVLFCGDGAEHEAVILALPGDGVQLGVEATRRPEVEPRCRLELGIALLKGEKLDWVLQKLAELGVYAVTLLQTARAVPHLPDDRWPRRRERYEAVLREAVEQCGGVRLPELRGPLPLLDYLRAPGAGTTAIGDPQSPLSLRDLLPCSPAALRLLIGPEGGFAPEEMELAGAAGAGAFSLGKRVLRSETAAITAAAVVLERVG
jgi:16S rRNA (uracil1498-N3)-methyltransferase